MKRTKEFELMRCVDCGTEYPYPSMFPVPIYAECWKCCWDRHVRHAHPPTRAEKRKLKQRIRNRVEIEFDKELRERKKDDLIKSESHKAVIKELRGVE